MAGMGGDAGGMEIINLTILECKYTVTVFITTDSSDNKSNHIGM